MSHTSLLQNFKNSTNQNFTNITEIMQQLCNILKRFVTNF